MPLPDSSLLARNVTTPASSLVVGDVRVELDSMRVWAGGENPTLTAQEFELLVLLAQQAGKPVSQDDLAAAMWSEGAAAEHRQHLSVLVSRLRVKLAASRLCRVMAAP
jgi:DNA-binding response OmpR family regulator